MMTKLSLFGLDRCSDEEEKVQSMNLRRTLPLLQSYIRMPYRGRSGKNRLLVSMRNPRLEKLAAWPQGVLTRKSGEPIGLLMPKVADRKDIHHLYSPKSRRTVFLRADWRFLISSIRKLRREPFALFTRRVALLVM